MRSYRKVNKFDINGIFIGINNMSNDVNNYKEDYLSESDEESPSRIFKSGYNIMAKKESITP